MKLGFKKAKLAVKNYLNSTTLPVSLWAVTLQADEGARSAGRISELYPSLFDYEQLIPSGFRCFWKKQTGLLAGDGIYSVDLREKAIQDYPCPDM